MRAVTGGIFDEFFNGLSKFAVDILPFLPYVIFWCCDKKWGYKFMVITRLGERYLLGRLREETDKSTR